jgi:hypothetical protein
MPREGCGVADGLLNAGQPLELPTRGRQDGQLAARRHPSGRLHSAQHCRQKIRRFRRCHRLRRLHRVDTSTTAGGGGNEMREGIAEVGMMAPRVIVQQRPQGGTVLARVQDQHLRWKSQRMKIQRLGYIFSIDFKSIP